MRNVVTPQLLMYILIFSGNIPFVSKITCIFSLYYMIVGKVLELLMNLLTSHEPSVYLFIYSDARLMKPTIIVVVIVLHAYHV